MNSEEAEMLRVILLKELDWVKDASHSDQLSGGQQQKSRLQGQSLQ